MGVISSLQYFSAYGMSLAYSTSGIPPGGLTATASGGGNTGFVLRHCYAPTIHRDMIYRKLVN